MKKFLSISSAGEITQEHIGLNPPEPSLGGFVVEVSADFDSRAYWHNGEEFELRTEINLSVDKTVIVADGNDAALITGVPVDANVTWPDAVATSGNSDIEFAVDLPGTYTLRFTAIAYLDQEVTIEAVAAA